jgi:hypothetical protein
VTVEHVLEDRGERGDVGDLALAHNPGGECAGGRALDGDLTGSRLDCGDVPWLDIKSYY